MSKRDAAVAVAARIAKYNREGFPLMIDLDEQLDEFYEAAMKLTELAIALDGCGDPMPSLQPEIGIYVETE